MKYGNLSIKLPSLTLEMEALKDLLSKGEITDSEYRTKVSRLQRARNMTLALTNGAYTPRTKGRKRVKLEEMRQDAVVDQTMGMRDRILAETAAAMEEINQRPAVTASTESSETPVSLEPMNE